MTDGNVVSKPVYLSLQRGPSQAQHPVQLSIEHDTPSPPTLFPWDRLPDELQLLVLENPMLFPNGITPRKHRVFVDMRIVPLTRTGNKKLETMAKDMYYHSNAFRTTPSDINLGHCIPLRIGRQMRILELTIKALPRPENAFKEHAGGDYQWYHQWIQSCPTIQVLRLVLEVRIVQPFEHTGDTFCGLLHAETLRRLASAVRPEIRALNPGRTTFKVKCEGCPYRNSEHDDIDCNCAREFEENIMALIKAP
jgi:hypothetical protein